MEPVQDLSGLSIPELIQEMLRTRTRNFPECNLAPRELCRRVIQQEDAGPIWLHMLILEAQSAFEKDLRVSHRKRK